MRDSIKEVTVFIRGRYYKLRATLMNNEYYAWSAFRQSKYGGWEKIPTWTRAQERAFPKLVAEAAHEYVCMLNKQINPDFVSV